MYSLNIYTKLIRVSSPLCPPNFFRFQQIDLSDGGGHWATDMALLSAGLGLEIHENKLNCNRADFPLKAFLVTLGCSRQSMTQQTSLPSSIHAFINHRVWDKLK